MAVGFLMVCDSCKREERVEDFISRPDGWIFTKGKPGNPLGVGTKDLCPDCQERLVQEAWAVTNGKSYVLLGARRKVVT